MYVFFDTETNGLPKSWKAEPTDVDNWPRIIQLAFIVTDEDFNEVERYCELIQPDGWKIPKEKFWLEELHKKLFGHVFDGAHDALADVSATVRCAKELVAMGYINMD